MITSMGCSPSCLLPLPAKTYDGTQCLGTAGGTLATFHQADVVPRRTGSLKLTWAVRPCNVCYDVATPLPQGVAVPHLIPDQAAYHACGNPFGSVNTLDD